jgi:exopolysaccharide biosynthesis predicted pyruvyltransferase EpsI/O-antigen/teichoic acid export membrane protein
MLNSPYSKESVRQGILHYLLGRGLAGLAGFATVILLVRYMDVQSYAGFTALSGIIVMAGIFAGLGLERAISRFVPEARLERSANELGQFIWRISAIKLVASLVVSLVFFISWNQILRIFPDVHLVQFPISLVCFVVAETLFQHFSSVLQALIKQKALTRILIVQWAGRLVMIAWAILGDKSISLEESLWIMAIPEAVGVLVFVLVITQYLSGLRSDQKALHKQPASNQESPWPDWQAIFKMAGNNYGFTLLAAPPQGYFMKMLAAAFLPTQMVAAYGFFINIAERARQYIPLHLLYNLIEPVMIGNYLQNRDFATLNYRCELLYKSNLILLVPVLAWVAAAGTFIIASLTGGKYEEYLWLLLVVMFQLMIGSHVVLLQLILNSVGASLTLIRAGIFALITMLLFLAITMLFSTNFLMIGPLVFSLVCNLYIVQALKREGYPYKLSWQLFAGVSISGLIAFLIVFIAIGQHVLTFNQPYIMSIASGMLTAVIYAASLYFFKAIHSDELGLVKSLFNVKSASTKDVPVIDNQPDSNIISHLQNEAGKVLDAIISKDAHVILLDYPNNTNVGDSLIWLGEIAYLRSRGLNPAYVCDSKNYNALNIKKILNKNSMILMHGGGNFGTMWKEIHAFRLRVLRDFPQVPIVQMPQTIHFDNESKVSEIAEIIKVQGNYTLLARSQASYKFAQQHFSAKVYLCPDMAFFIGEINTSNRMIFDRFILARTDHEKSSNSLIESVDQLENLSYELSDWLQASWQERFVHRIEIHTQWLRSFLDPNNQTLLYLWNKLSYLRFARGVSLLNRGRVIITDRLHVHILSILLNKPHVIIDNVYGKLGNFYQTWTSSHAQVKFVTDVTKVHAAAYELDVFLRQHEYTCAYS